MMSISRGNAAAPCALLVFFFSSTPPSGEEEVRRSRARAASFPFFGRARAVLERDDLTMLFKLGELFRARAWEEIGRVSRARGIMQFFSVRAFTVDARAEPF